MTQNEVAASVTDIAIIVPHTHWDREWYRPFQRFRYNLVRLIDELLDCLKDKDYRFMLDGQTVVLEDYFEIRPERQEELLTHIRAGRVSVGPWYLLPDEWLVGGESLIRNLEYSHDLAARLGIPLMQIAYLPDQFGHTSAIPQLVRNLTGLRAAVLWRGVPWSLKTTLFQWRSHANSPDSLLTVYMPGGYGNASRFPEDYDGFVDLARGLIQDLRPFSAVPVYLLMNGSDHLFPQPFVTAYAKRLSSPELDVSVDGLERYLDLAENAVQSQGVELPVYVGELRSPARAPMLQDTYSARMWIKVWSQRVEDLLVLKAEPIGAHLHELLNLEYPSGFLTTAWKWFLQNQPHDSICGCSVDQTHEEMKARFSWAQSIAEAVIEGYSESIQKSIVPSDESQVLVFHSGPTSRTPTYFEFSFPRGADIRSLRSPDGKAYAVQRVRAHDDIFLDMTLGITAAKMGMKLLPGRKLMDFYINGVEYHEGAEPGLLELRFDADYQPLGDFDMEAFKREAREILASKAYKKIHIVAARPTQTVYASVVPLNSWSFACLSASPDQPEPEPKPEVVPLTATTERVANRFYQVVFSKDGTLSLTNKVTGCVYRRLHVFEDFGDRGDEYTFGMVPPDYVSVTDVKRSLRTSGPLFAEVEQSMVLTLRDRLDDTRTARVGKTEVPVESVFRFYRDTPRVEIVTRIVNRTRDHRLRICFDLPFKSEHTTTSTHFGCIRRLAAPEPMPTPDQLRESVSTYPEMPSGIQAQKRFIRVDDANGPDAITVFNRGLPEVELANGYRIALTLVRSVGWLSRSDFPERPMHAGPAEPTPGAQEMGTEYEFFYGFMVHSSSDPLHISAEESEAAGATPLAFTAYKAVFPEKLSSPLLELDNPSIRVSSLRIRGNSLLVTLYNMSDVQETVTLTLAGLQKMADEVKMDGTVIRSHTERGRIPVTFAPREIRMLALRQ
ncbi:MAG: hypothetical protein HXY34_07835 [Candidatus Thorarchaeota archaeon]|nr:hypothetical protein [Candidatus Thorarchaeota archaeon]